MSEHLSFSKDEARDGFCEVAAEKNGKLPIKAFTWLITHFSRAGDYVVDLFSENASAIIASMKIARHGIFLRKRGGAGACSMSPGRPRSTPPSHGKIVLHIVHIVLHTLLLLTELAGIFLPF